MTRPPLLPRAEAQHSAAPRGEAWIWLPAPGVVASEVTGELETGVSSALSAAVRRAVAENARVSIFHDWEELTGYQPEARLQLTDLGREFKKQIEMSNILLRSRIVALAVQAASLLIPNIRVHTSRATLDVALREAILSARGRTPPREGRS